MASKNRRWHKYRGTYQRITLAGRERGLKRAMVRRAIAFKRRGTMAVPRG
jgi:hypothetical protein